MKKVPLSEVEDDLSRFIQLAANEEIVVTQHGRAAAVLIGFEHEDDWLDYQLEHDPRFVARMEAARGSLDAGHGIPIEKVREQLGLAAARPRIASPSKRAAAPKRPARKSRSK